MAPGSVYRENRTCHALIDMRNPFTVWECAIGRMRSACDVPNGVAVSCFLYNKIRATSEGGIVWLKREFELEGIRAREYPDKVSRLSGLFLFSDNASARHGGRAWRMHSATTEISEVNFSIERGNWHDSRWIDDTTSPVSEWGKKYWSGQPKDASPRWELIASGIGLVVTKSVRERCYMSASARDPHASLFLSGAAGAFALGNQDTGLCIPYISVRNGKIYGSYSMFGEDFRNLDWDFIACECKRRGYIFPVRQEINNELRTPNFEEMNFEIAYPV